MNIVHVMSYIVKVVIKFGYDVLYNAYYGIHMPPVMSYSVCVMSSMEGVLTYTVEKMSVLTGFKSDIALG